jgi:hypothetical protein
LPLSSAQHLLDLWFYLRAGANAFNIGGDERLVAAPPLKKFAERRPRSSGKFANADYETIPERFDRPIVSPVRRDRGVEDPNFGGRGWAGL